MSGGNGSGDELPTFEPPYSEVEPWLRGLHSLVAVSLMVVSLTGNTLVLWVVVRNKELQYRSILAGMGAVAVNILFSLVTSPQVVAGSITGEWPFGHVGCVVVGFVSNGIFYVRWINTFLIAVDRFLYIITPFWYQRNSKPVLVTLTVVTWTVPFISSVPSAVLRSYSFRSTFTLCAINCERDDICYNTYILLFTVYIVIGVLLPTAIYTFLYCYGKKKRREMNREMGTHAQEDTPDEPPAINGHLPSEHYLSARRPSTDLVSIDEEDETKSIAMQDFSQAPGPTHLDLGTAHSHQVIDVTRLPTDTSSAESEQILHAVTPGDCRQDNRHCIAEEVDLADPGVLQRQKQLGHRRGSEGSGTGSASSHQLGPRRTSIVVLSRAALTALIPSRHNVATQRRERQAMVTFVIIFTNLVMTQILLFILSAMRRQEYYQSIPIWVHMVAVNLFLLAPALEPIIIVKNQDFKRVFTKMFRRRHPFSLTHSVATR